MQQLPECLKCGDPVGDTAFACRRCAADTAGYLRTVITVAAEVEVTVARLARYGDRGGQALTPAEDVAVPGPANRTQPVEVFGWPASKDRPRKAALRPTALPFNPGTAQRAYAAINTITTWARHVTEERGHGPQRPAAMVGPLCRAGWGCTHDTCTVIRARTVPHPAARAALFLLDQLDWLRHRIEAVDALDELAAAAATLRRVVDSPPPVQYAGPCWVELDDGRCEFELYAHAGSASVKCGGCGVVHQVPQRRGWLLDEAENVLGHAAMLAAALSALDRPVTSSMIRNYADRGRIVAHGHDERGRPLYRVGDVLDVLADIARRKGAAA